MFFRVFFFNRLGIMCLLIVFGIVWAFLFTQSDDFAKIIAFSWKLFFANIQTGLILLRFGFLVN